MITGIRQSPNLKGAWNDHHRRWLASAAWRRAAKLGASPLPGGDSVMPWTRERYLDEIGTDDDWHIEPDYLRA